MFEEDAIEARFFAKMKDEADLEIRRREASKELPLCIRVERFPGFGLDDHRTGDAHVHSLVRQRFTAKGRGDATVEQGRVGSHAAISSTVPSLPRVRNSLTQERQRKVVSETLYPVTDLVRVFSYAS